MAFEVFGADAQRRLFAGMAKQRQHFGDFLRLFDAELKHRPGGALFAQHLALYPAAAVGFLGKGGDTLVFGLQNDAAVVKVLAKTGHRVGGGHVTAGFGDPAAQDLVFYVL